MLLGKKEEPRSLFRIKLVEYKYLDEEKLAATNLNYSSKVYAPSLDLWFN